MAKPFFVPNYAFFICFHVSTKKLSPKVAEVKVLDFVFKNVAIFTSAGEVEYCDYILSEEDHGAHEVVPNMRHVNCCFARLVARFLLSLTDKRHVHC